MRKLSTYIDNIEYEYVITYSGLRGAAWTKLKVENRAKIKQLEKDMETARYMQKPKLGQEMEALLEEIDAYESRIVQKGGLLHKSTLPIRRLEKGAAELKALLNILSSQTPQQVASGCIPIYRDALAFYSGQNELMGIVHICFECCFISDDNDVEFDVDMDVYPKLKQVLSNIGHPIGE